MLEEKNTEEAFLWIVELLKKHSIPFQVSGGFAARLYGSTRELADIDIGIPDESFYKILPDVKEHIIYGPEHYHDDEWDLRLMTLKYENQEIDIMGIDAIKIFDKTNKIWIPAYHDFSMIENREVYGVIVPVIPKETLVVYKKKIGREVDILDIKAMNRK